MARDSDVYYSFRFTNEQADGGHPHFAYMKLDPSASFEKHFAMLEGNNPNVKYDRASVKRFNSQHEVMAYNAKLAEDANAANPERVDANQQFPGEPNRILSAGAPTL